MGSSSNQLLLCFIPRRAHRLLALSSKGKKALSLSAAAAPAASQLFFLRLRFNGRACEHIHGLIPELPFLSVDSHTSEQSHQINSASTVCSEELAALSASVEGFIVASPVHFLY